MVAPFRHEELKQKDKTIFLWFKFIFIYYYLGKVFFWVSEEKLQEKKKEETQNSVASELSDPSFPR